MKLTEIAKKFGEQVSLNTADAMVLGTASSPEITALYIVAKSLLGAALDLRADRAKQFIQFAAENSHKFNQEVLGDEQIQDGFIFSLQQYITERNELKREAILAILLGFVNSSDRKNFELEKLNNVMKLVSVEDIEIVKVWVDGTVEQWLRMQFHDETTIKQQSSYPLNVAQYGELILWEMKGMKKFTSKDYTFEKLSYLVGVGLLTEDAGTSWDGNGSFKLSEFGREFIKYIRTS